MTWRSCEATVSASVTACPAPMASSNTCANADDAALPEGVRDASRCRCIHEATSISPLRSAFEFPDELPWVGMVGYDGYGPRRGNGGIKNVQGDARRCPNDTTEFIR